MTDFYSRSRPLTMRKDVPNAAARVDTRSQLTHPNHHAYHDANGTAKLSTTVVHALADVTGMDVTDVEASLAESIDPEGLDRLFSKRDDRRSPGGHVAFSVRGYPVTVYSNGQIVITPPENAHR